VSFCFRFCFCFCFRTCFYSHLGSRFLGTPRTAIRLGGVYGGARPVFLPCASVAWFCECLASAPSFPQEIMSDWVF
jgi:hypothetical protein